MITLVVSPSDLRGVEVRVEGPAYRHLFRARRLAANAVVRLVDGEGTARFGRAQEVTASEAWLSLGEDAPTNEPAMYLELLAPVPKGSRLSWMVEKATEIGASAIRLMHAERAPRRISASTLARLKRVAVAAVEQSHRSVVPVVSGAHDFSGLPVLLESLQERWFLQPGATEPSESSVETRAALLVGPEGGWTAGELEQLGEWGCQALGLGPTIMRIETAAAVGCARLLIKDLFQ